MEEYDLIIEMSTTPNDDSQKTGTLPMVLCASPEYLKNNRTPYFPDELNKHNCLLVGKELTTKWMLNIEGEVYNFTVKGNLNSYNENIIKSAAIAGLGIAMLPRFFVEKELKEGTLIRILPQYIPTPMVISLSSPKKSKKENIIHMLTHFLKHSKNII